MSERESMLQTPLSSWEAGLLACRLRSGLEIINAEPVCVLEKGSEVRRAHPVGRGGSQGDRRAFARLKENGCPMADVPVTENHHWVMSGSGHMPIPHIFTPGWMHNKGTYTGSLGNLCRWLAGQSRKSGVEISSRLSGGRKSSTMMMARLKALRRVTWALLRDGSHKPDYMPGMELPAKYATLFGRMRVAT